MGNGVHKHKTHLRPGVGVFDVLALRIRHVRLQVVRGCAVGRHGRRHGTTVGAPFLRFFQRRERLNYQEYSSEFAYVHKVVQRLNERRKVAKSTANQKE